MVATQKCTISTKVLPYPPLLRGHGRGNRTFFTIKCAKRRDFSDNNSETNQKPTTIGIKLRAPFPILAKSAIAVFGLGFIDAGYSGDWSRIGAISNEVEDLLKAAAFLVIPLCVFAILSISEEEPEL